jgi:hypothetical protein
MLDNHKLRTGSPPDTCWHPSYGRVEDIREWSGMRFPMLISKSVCIAGDVMLAVIARFKRAKSASQVRAELHGK